MTITQTYLKNILNYNQETGIFEWLDVKRLIGANLNSSCGTKHHTGYMTIMIDGKRYQAHRLAWIYMMGENPKEFIDHINGIKDDNRFCNLRIATRSQNGMNRVQSDNKLNEKDIVLYHNKSKGKVYTYYRVQILINKKQHAKHFKTLEDAKNYRDSKLNEIHGEFHKIK